MSFHNIYVVLHCITEYNMYHKMLIWQYDPKAGRPTTYSQNADVHFKVYIVYDRLLNGKTAAECSGA